MGHNTHTSCPAANRGNQWTCRRKHKSKKSRTAKYQVSAAAIQQANTIAKTQAAEEEAAVKAPAAAKQFEGGGACGQGTVMHLLSNGSSDDESSDDESSDDKSSDESSDDKSSDESSDESSAKKTPAAAKLKHCPRLATLQKRRSHLARRLRNAAALRRLRNAAAAVRKHRSRLAQRLRSAAAAAQKRSRTGSSDDSMPQADTHKEALAAASADPNRSINSDDKVSVNRNKREKVQQGVKKGQPQRLGAEVSFGQQQVQAKQKATEWVNDKKKAHPKNAKKKKAQRQNELLAAVRTHVFWKAAPQNLECLKSACKKKAPKTLQRFLRNAQAMNAATLEHCQKVLLNEYIELLTKMLSSDDNEEDVTEGVSTEQLSNNPRKEKFQAFQLKLSILFPTTVHKENDDDDEDEDEDDRPLRQVYATPKALADADAAARDVVNASSIKDVPNTDRSPPRARGGPLHAQKQRNERAKLQNAELCKKRNELDGQCQAAEAKLEELRKAIEEQQRIQSKIQCGTMATLHAQVKTLTENIAAEQQKNALLRNTINVANNTLSQVYTESRLKENKLRQALVAAQQENASLRNTFTREETEVATYLFGKQWVEARRQASETQVKALAEQLQTAEKSNAELSAELDFLMKHSANYVPE